MEIHPKKKIQPTPTTFGSGILKRKPQTTQRHRHQTRRKTTRPLGTSNTYHRFTAVTAWPQGHVQLQGRWHDLPPELDKKCLKFQLYHSVGQWGEKKHSWFCILLLLTCFTRFYHRPRHPEIPTGFVISSWSFDENGCTRCHWNWGYVGGYKSLSKHVRSYIGW